MEKMDIYEQCREVPESAKKTIKGGRLAGMTDINPMWRIKKLTELFGMVGIGWYYEIDDKRIEDRNNETCAFVDIKLYVKVDDQWSAPICGTGGSKLVSVERNGAYVNDECFKMATTDALSVACKQIGIGADVYWEKDTTKYQTGEDMQALPTYKEEKTTTNKKSAKPEVKTEEAPRDLKADIPGYPTKDEMLKLARKQYPEGSENLENLLKCWKINKLEDASIAQLAVIYKRYGEKK